MVDALERFRARDQVLARSVLDRLLDAAPEVSRDPQLSLADQVRELREAIRRDLEALLNTRRCPASPPAALEDLPASLVSYGVDGLVSASLVTDEAKLALARSLERRIARFETRLDDVRVTILKNRIQGERALRMRIEATFRLHDGLPSISFESTIDPSSQRFQVEPAHG